MSLTESRGALLTLCLAACAPAAPPGPVKPAPVASTPVYHGDPCLTLGAAEEAKVKTTFGEESKKALAAHPDSAHGGINELPTEIPALLGKCIRHDGGAFVVTVDWMRTADQWGPAIDVRWSLTHVDAAGNKVSITPGENEDDLGDAKRANLLVGGEDTLQAEVTAFDYDGDRVPEIAVRLHGHAHEGASWTRGRIYAFKGGKLGVYEPAKNLDFDELIDVDGDGRPDAKTFAGYVDTLTACGSGFEYTVTGPSFIAHSLSNGTFSMTDEVAKAAAKKECPALPKPIVPKGEEGDFETAAKNAICARVWGADTHDILSQLDAACTKVAASGQCKAGECAGRSTLDAWTRAAPPLSLAH